MQSCNSHVKACLITVEPEEANFFIIEIAGKRKAE